MEWITQPWPWYVAGPLIAFILFLMLFFGRRFGVSSTLETMCSIGGAGKLTSYFDFNWRDRMWNVTFIIGAIIGGFIASNFLTASVAVDLNPVTVESLQNMGIAEPGKDYVPEIFSFDNLFTFQGFVFMILGGFLIGFGTRYAGGCTSGHAISGLSDLQLPSLIAVIGFFIGGLIVTHIVIPAVL